MDINKRRDQKHKIMVEMISIYCKGHNHTISNGEFCDECSALLDYSLGRTTRCPHIENTLFCSNCPTPCYGKVQKEQVRIAMRYSGPRLFFKRPLTVIKHVVYDYATRNRKKAAV